jgi:hypothetical protein
VASESKIDATGTVKLKTLDEALLLLQRVHGIVEQYAVAYKRGQPTSAYVMNLRRQLPSLAANLKAHFSLIADEVLALNLATSRGASEQTRVRLLREGVARIRTSMEIAAIQTRAKHQADDEKPSVPDGENAR